jgi:adenosylhomocysteine nucleosidase
MVRYLHSARALLDSIMLLRWLVNQYLRDAAEGKLREVVGGIATSGGTPAPVERPRPSSPPAVATETGEQASPTEFLACDLAFIFALGVESGGLVDLLRDSETSSHPHGVERAGKLGRHEVVIVEGGVGQKAAGRSTAEAIKFYQPKCVISAGFAGGLDEKLRRGHIVMADEVMNLAGETIAIDLRLDRESLAATKGLHIGRLLTVDSILREPAERRELAAKHASIACDMETFAIAAACGRQGIPFLAIRIISDAVDDELPPEIEHLLKQKSLAGKLGAAAGAVFKRFGAAKDLWKLREDALKASDRLAKFLVGVTQQLRANDE